MDHRHHSHHQRPVPPRGSLRTTSIDSHHTYQQDDKHQAWWYDKDHADDERQSGPQVPLGRRAWVGTTHITLTTSVARTTIVSSGNALVSVLDRRRHAVDDEDRHRSACRFEFQAQLFLDGGPDTYGWIPFGGGTRRCIGAAFAELEMRVVLSTILERTTLRPASRKPERMVRRNVTLSPRGGTPAILVDRS